MSVTVINEKLKIGNSVTLYRGGPMIGDTSFLGRRCSIVAVIV